MANANNDMFKLKGFYDHVHGAHSGFYGHWHLPYDDGIRGDACVQGCLAEKSVSWL
jgi:hypothetical protein